MSITPPTTYTGPAGSKSDFFVDPPPEVGSVLAAFSSLAPGQAPAGRGGGLGTALLYTAVLLVVLAVPIALVVANLPAPNTWLVIGALGVAALAVTVYVAIMSDLADTRRTSDFCAYVGTNGLALFRCRGRRDNLISQQVLVFGDVTSMSGKTTHLVFDGVYSRTTYGYRWFGAGGKVLLEVDGTHLSFKEPPPPVSDYHFAREAERAWSRQLLERVSEAVAGGREYPFTYARGEFRVGRGVLRVCAGGKETVFRPDEIKSICHFEANDGPTLSIERHPRPGDKSAPTEYVTVGWMCDTVVFLTALDVYGGFTVV